MDQRPCGVLLVESDPDLQWKLARMLTVEGNRVVGTSSGDGALALVAEWTVDVVLVDEDLPGMDGLQVIRRLQEACPGILCVLLASPEGADVHELQVAARLAGAAACIPRPLDLERLRQILAGLPMPSEVRPVIDLEGAAE